MKGRSLLSGVILALCCVFTACSATVKLPICPKIAENSYLTKNQGHGKLLGRFVVEQTQARGIQARPLSYCAAEFSGPRREILWLYRNYPRLLCAYNPSLPGNCRTNYASCIGRVPLWIQHLQENREDLILNDPLFRKCCSKNTFSDPAPEQKPRTVSIRLPLCPRLATLSYATIEEGRGKLVGRFVAEQAVARKVEIIPLSSFVAEFKGPTKQIEWFKQNYGNLVCAFNNALVIEDEQTYLSCMHHVREWMTLIQTGKDAELMLKEHEYCPNCCGSE